MPKSRVLSCRTQAAVLTSGAIRYADVDADWDADWDVDWDADSTWTRSYGPVLARSITRSRYLVGHDLRGMGRENGIIALHQSTMIRAGHVNLEAHCRERPYLGETE